MSAHPKDGPPRAALRSLRRFVQPRAVVERCELCSLALPPEHPHLIQLSDRRLICACEACGVLFDNRGAGRYRRVPRDVYALPSLRLSDAAWQALGLPINLAFLMHSTAAEHVVAVYPSPGGATESLPPPDAWQMLLEDNPSLRNLEPDVEALLVNRLGAEAEHYRVGIDQCYKLVGVVRTHWRGLSGGAELWQEVGRFFAALKERAHPVGGAADA